MKKIYTIIGIMVIGIAVFLIYTNTLVIQTIPETNTLETATTPAEILETPVQPAPEEHTTTNTVHTIAYTADGFSPTIITIQKNDTVQWVNTTNRDMWPASAMHPTHTAYPESGITKCNTAEESHIFDACRGIGTGETYTFTFTEAGTWGYHDHLNARSSGKIIVE